MSGLVEVLSKTTIILNRLRFRRLTGIFDASAELIRLQMTVSGWLVPRQNTFNHGP